MQVIISITSFQHKL